jgi:uracil-DNA glycosylase
LTEDNELLAQKLSELAQSLQALRKMGRQLTARQEKLVELARTQPRLSPVEVKAPAVTQGATPVSAKPGEQQERLDAIRAEIGDCTRCKLHKGRNQIVFGVGSPSAELLFIGEGPGAEEDKQGIPFVGRAGDLLSKMIVAMGKTREDVYIANIVKCRPPGNRDPEADEVSTCIGFLHEQLVTIQPKVIVCLGRIAVQNLLDTKTPISQLRGQWQELGGVPVMPTYHPAYLLRSPSAKKPAWDDLKQVMDRLGWPLPKKKKG